MRIFLVENEEGEVFLVKADLPENAIQKYKDYLTDDDIRVYYDGHVARVEYLNKQTVQYSPTLIPLDIPSFEEYREEFWGEIKVEGELDLSRDVTPIEQCGLAAYL